MVVSTLLWTILYLFLIWFAVVEKHRLFLSSCAISCFLSWFMPITLIGTLRQGALFAPWVPFNFLSSIRSWGACVVTLVSEFLLSFSFAAVFMYWVISRLSTFAGLVTAFWSWVVSTFIYNYWFACIKSSFEAVLLQWALSASWTSGFLCSGVLSPRYTNPLPSVSTSTAQPKA